MKKLTQYAVAAMLVVGSIACTENKVTETTNTGEPAVVSTAPAETSTETGSLTETSTTTETTATTEAPAPGTATATDAPTTTDATTSTNPQ